MPLSTLANRLAAMSFRDRAAFIERNVPPEQVGLLRTLFLRAPILPVPILPASEDE